MTKFFLKNAAFLITAKMSYVITKTIESQMMVGNELRAVVSNYGLSAVMVCQRPSTTTNNMVSILVSMAV